MSRSKLSFFDDLFGNPLPNKSSIGNKAFLDFEDSLSLDKKKETEGGCDFFDFSIPVIHSSKKTQDNQYNDKIFSVDITEKPSIDKSCIEESDFFIKNDSYLFRAECDSNESCEGVEDEFSGFDFTSLPEFDRNIDGEEIEFHKEDIFDNEVIEDKVELKIEENVDSQEEILRHVKSIFDDTPTPSKKLNENHLVVEKDFFNHEQRKAWIDFSETLNMLMNR